MKRKVIIGIGAGLILAINFGGIYFLNRKVDKIAVVDVIKVFNEFKLKKELEARVEPTLTRYSGSIDSITSLMNRANEVGDSFRHRMFTGALYQLQQEAGQVYEISNKNINEQVWKRLNPLIDDFGKRNGYRALIGANGMGSVLYKDDATDATSDIIKYVNEKYDKGN